MIDVRPEATPNPNAIKFTLDRPSTEGRAQTFRAGSDPAESPLGARIFALDGVTNVFMTANFVSVTKEDDISWDELAPLVVAELEDHFGEAG
jgi:Scaffold protein Nfu/NifU N terminal